MNNLLKATILILFSMCFLVAAKADITSTNSLASSKLESGYIHITPNDHLFYVLARSKTATAPLAIFLNGGPGASSMTGAFMTNGPYRLLQPFHHDDDMQIKENRWSWNKIANVVYLDQPRYVGYSYGDGPYVTSLKDAGHDFLNWLQLFYQRYPEFAQRPLYLTGESFAGAYVAEYAHQILQHNKQHPENSIYLSGLFIQSGAIGDDQRYGLDVSPQYQLHFLCKQNMLAASECTPQLEGNLWDTLKLCMLDIADSKKIPTATVKISDVYAAAKSSKTCKKYFDEVSLHTKMQAFKVPDSPNIPEPIRGKVVQEPIDRMEFSAASKIRHYLAYSPGPWNMKLVCQPSGGFPPWCYDDYKVTKFFNDPVTKSQLGKGLIPGHVQWEFAKFLIPLTLIGTKTPVWTIEAYYTEALKNNIPVVFVFGKNDWNINYLSAQVISNQIAYKAYGQVIFKQLPSPISSMKALTVGDHQRVGEYQTLQNFTFAQIDDAGHIIGMDQPEIIYKLFSVLLSKSIG